MCGILGALTCLDAHIIRPSLENALKKIDHRGPDDSGLDQFKVDNCDLYLGHQRLSILDLSDAGHQPMMAANGRYILIFNGEIYNYKELREQLERDGVRFESNTDSEVLLKSWIKWNEASLLKFEGMFAFTIYDSVQKELFIARDAFGIKPFYYSLFGSELRFCSEIPSLVSTLPQKPELNLQRAYEYLNFSLYDNQKDTFFKGIYRLYPGHFAKIDLKELHQLPSKEDNSHHIEQKQWWNPEISEVPRQSFENTSDELRHRFLENIKLHLRSDVPLGAALSGGLDSSAVVCAIRHLYPDMPINTFTFVAEGADVDEKKWSDLINVHANTKSHKVIVSTDELLNDIDDLIRVQGEPFGSTSIYAQYRVFKLARENGITVMLEGQGADEMLAGYNGYPDARIASMIQNYEWLKVLPFMKSWSQWPGRSIEEAKLQARAALSETLPDFIVDRIRGQQNIELQPWFNKDKLKDAGVDLMPQYASYELDEHHSGESRGRMLSERMRQALTKGGLQRLLRHGDRNSMRWSIESRVPFLTHPFAEFCLSLPESYHLSQNGETKHIFRHAMRGIIPDEVVFRKDKIGFATPEQKWLQQLDITDWLDDDILENLQFLNQNSVKRFMKDQMNGSIPFNFTTWRILNYIRWVKNSGIM